MDQDFILGEQRLLDCCKGLGVWVYPTSCFWSNCLISSLSCGE